MRIFGTRSIGVVVAAIIATGASAATSAAPAGSSFPDPVTWALMVASFMVIGAGIRSRKRSVVLA